MDSAPTGSFVRRGSCEAGHVRHRDGRADSRAIIRRDRSRVRGTRQIPPGSGELTRGDARPPVTEKDKLKFESELVVSRTITCPRYALGRTLAGPFARPERVGRARTYVGDKSLNIRIGGEEMAGGEIDGDFRTFRWPLRPASPRRSSDGRRRSALSELARSVRSPSVSESIRCAFRRCCVGSIGTAVVIQFQPFLNKPPPLVTVTVTLLSLSSSLLQPLTACNVIECRYRWANRLPLDRAGLESVRGLLGVRNYRTRTSDSFLRTDAAPGQGWVTR